MIRAEQRVEVSGAQKSGVDCAGCDGIGDLSPLKSG